MRHINREYLAEGKSISSVELFWCLWVLFNERLARSSHNPPLSGNLIPRQPQSRVTYTPRKVYPTYFSGAFFVNYHWLSVAREEFTMVNILTIFKLRIGNYYYYHLARFPPLAGR